MIVILNFSDHNFKRAVDACLAGSQKLSKSKITDLDEARKFCEDEIKRKDIRIGDTVLIERAGDVIPKVVKVIQEKRPAVTKRFTLPTNCPVCKHQVYQTDGEAILRCGNTSCTKQIKGRLKHFCSKWAMDIDGLGEKVINQLVDEG